MNTNAVVCSLAALALIVSSLASAQAGDAANRDVGMDLAVGIGAAASAMVAPPPRVYVPPRPPAAYYAPPGVVYATPIQRPYFAPPGTVISDPYREPRHQLLYLPPY